MILFIYLVIILVISLLFSCALKYHIYIYIYIYICHPSFSSQLQDSALIQECNMSIEIVLLHVTMAHNVLAALLFIFLSYQGLILIYTYQEEEKVHLCLSKGHYGGIKREQIIFEENCYAPPNHVFIILPHQFKEEFELLVTLCIIM